MTFKPSVTILTPVFNDWDCIPCLLQDFAHIKSQVNRIELIIIDDGSTKESRLNEKDLPTWLDAITIVRLGRNLGHQRAIAIGLAYVVRMGTADAIMTLDSDGEDHPRDATLLLQEWLRNRNSITVAARSRRSEGFSFKCLYGIYKAMFASLTGARLDFGNFAILSLGNAARLIYMPELWNHYPAAILRSGIMIRKLRVNRSSRYLGRSKMSPVALINHGLSSVSVFFDIVLARMLIGTLVLSLLLLLIALAVAFIRISTDLAIPGWATLSLGITLLGILQVLATQVIIIFLAFANRSNLQRPTFLLASEYIAETTMLRE